MDAALALKKQFDQQQITTFAEAKGYLDNSILFHQLQEEFELTSLNLLHRLLELMEIPFADQYEKVQKWRDQLADMTFCGDGFSLSGKSNDILACYNAMITHVLMRLNFSNHPQINAGVEWIIQYQNISRGVACLWKGESINKYGGCMKSTPCYIGVVKSMLVLSQAVQRKEFGDLNIQSKLSKGLEYILEHQVYLRKSTAQPITPYLTKLTFPFTYKTNVIEILRLLKENQKLDDPRCRLALEYLKKKKKKQGYWTVNSVPYPKYWVSFDPIKQKGQWISHEIEKLV